MTQKPTVNMDFQNLQQASISIKMICTNLINLLWIVDDKDTISTTEYLHAVVSIHVEESLQGENAIESKLMFIPAPNERHTIYFKALYEADNNERRIYRSESVTVKLLQSKCISIIKIMY